MADAISLIARRRCHLKIIHLLQQGGGGGGVGGGIAFVLQRISAAS